MYILKINEIAWSDPNSAPQFRIIPAYSVGGEEMNGNHLEDLKKEVKEIRDRHPAISIDNAFVSWFLRAFITDNEESAIKALTGGAKDKGVDAIYTDHNSRIVFIVQGKYHQGPKPPSENRSDVIALGDLGRVLLNDEPREFRSLLKDSDLSVKDELEKARKLIHKHGYSQAHL